MHMLATNLCECFAILIDETLLDIWFSSIGLSSSGVRAISNLTIMEPDFLNSRTFNIVKSYYENERGCLISNSIMDPIVMRSGQYLTTCTMEYNILCISILMVIWNNSGTQERIGGDIDIEFKISLCLLMYMFQII